MLTRARDRPFRRLLGLVGPSSSLVRDLNRVTIITKYKGEERGMATGDDGLGNLEGKYDGYTVYDRDGDKIGKVDELFVDENDREEYIGVKTGLFGLSGTTLIPIQIVNVDDGDKSLRVDATKESIKDAPNYDNEDDIGPEYENSVLQHFGIGPSGSSESRGSYGRNPNADDQSAGQTRTGGDTGDQDRGDRESESTSTTSASSDRNTEGRGSSGGEVERDEGSGDETERSESTGEGAPVGYRDAEAGSQSEGMGLTTRRRRVRRRSLREENEEIFEEEETSGRPE